jgi:hypothetical protein
MPTTTSLSELGKRRCQRLEKERLQQRHYHAILACTGVHGVIANKHGVLTETANTNGLVSDTVRFGQGFE